ncbi:type IV pilus assembly protein PilV [Paraburkholderia diazotrophica]|uniref:Type IV pilus assembly protein PilV n=1 Tax=Paraburkholderia diazotrophica TaxID=667676 RepID=A0A1H7DRR7_9BURK|nr:type IV pilus assembly protein PilV [Paraburkholderia diazotrophica]
MFFSRAQSLIEVLIAVAVTAVTVLGLIAVQLSIARDGRATSYQAALIADAIAEAARAPFASESAPALGQWKTRAASILPKGDAAVSGAELSFARATWAAQLSPARNGTGSGDVIDMPASCGDVDVPQGRECIVVAFSR